MIFAIFLYTFSIGLIFWIPFNKVEESFQVQALHDNVYVDNLNDFDHFEFPGAVDRSFIPSYVNSRTLKLIIHVLNICGIPPSKILVLCIGRLILSLLALISFVYYYASCGKNSKKYFFIVLYTQFHILFYSTRFLSNYMALPFVTIGLAAAKNGKSKLFIWTVVFSAIILRCEVGLLFCIYAVTLLIQRKIKFGNLVIQTFIALGFFIVVSFYIDSIYWNKSTIPEINAFIFNIIKNENVKWGTMPFFWYFNTAMPKMMGAYIFIFVYQCLTHKRQFLYTMLPSLVYIFIYSFVAHKENRFIVYALIPATEIISQGMDSICKKHIMGNIFVKLSIVINVALCIIGCFRGYYNYPGATAMLKLTEYHKVHDTIHKTVHVDTFCLQNGVSRFITLKGLTVHKKEIQNYDNWSLEKDDINYLIMEVETSLHNINNL
ncbi:hypothetical protein A3Q56_02175 [Intoshia linei]|uniref:Mannosyltransferase n=1 Tax=Intoshia linei TaxID=1819745 RepID=A0A177B738_9BILA|nr:hypothetical protein A3Q56_02175 [Intoshia linei]